MEGISVSSTTGNMEMYTDTNTISQLSTTDDGREYQCEVVINTSPPVMAMGNFIMLNVIGEKLLQHTNFIMNHDSAYIIACVFLQNSYKAYS